VKVKIENDYIYIEGASTNYASMLREKLSYKDKQVEYSINRMKKNIYQRNSGAIRALEKKLYGSVMMEKGDQIIVPSGFTHLIPDTADITDNRHDTGDTISLPWQKKPFDLRDYQNEANELMQESYRGLINFATGLGKTLTALHAIRRFKKKTLIICPSTGIADNFYEELCSAFGENKVGYFGNGKKKIRDITVGIAQSVNNHITKFKEHGLGLIIIDEVHHLPADTFFTITEELADVGRIFGLTATDFRSDGKDIMITAGCGPTLIKRDLLWGVKNKWLAKPYIIVRGIETTGREYKSDKIKNYKEHVLKDKQMTGRIIADCAKFIEAGKSVLCLVQEISHGKEISEQLGLPFATSGDKNSSEYVKQLNKGKIPGLVGTASKIGEGVDTKNVDVLVLANFTASKGPLWQNLGRGLRIHEDNDQVIVLDYAPLGSKMLTRHAKQRIRYYKEITNNIRTIDV